MLIASCSSRRIIFSNWPTIKHVHTYQLPERSFDQSATTAIATISWSKDGSWLVLVAERGPTEIISVKSGCLKLLYTILEIDHPSCASFSNNTKRFVAVGSTNGLALLYDIKNKCEKRRFQRLKSSVFKIAYVATDSHLIVGCNNGELCMFNTFNSLMTATYRLNSYKKITNFRCHPQDRSMVCLTSADGVVAVWDTQINKTMNSIQLHNSCHVSDAVFMPLRNDLIASIGYDRSLCFYDTNANQCIMRVGTQETPTSLDICPQSVGLVIGTEDGRLLPYDIRNMKECIDKFDVHNNAAVKQVLFQKISYENLSTNENLSLDFTPRFGYKFDEDPSTDDTEADRVSKHSELGDLTLDERVSSLSKPCHQQQQQPSFLQKPTSSLSDTHIKNNSTINTSSNNTPGNGYGGGSITEGVKKLLFCKPNILSPARPLRKTTLDKRQEDTTMSIITDIENRTSDGEFSGKTCTNLTETVEGDGGDCISSGAAAAATAAAAAADDASTGKKIDALREEIMFEMQDMRAYVNMKFLDIQMAIVKEFLQVEYEFNAVKRSLTNIGEKLLVEENVRMRLENEELREKLRMYESLEYTSTTK